MAKHIDNVNAYRMNSSLQDIQSDIARLANQQNQLQHQQHQQHQHQQVNAEVKTERR